MDLRMRTLLRSRSLLFALCLTLFAAASCDPMPGQIVTDFCGTWTTTDLEGREETVLIERGRMVWEYGTEGAYECKLRINSYLDEENTLDFRIRCVERTGAENWVAYSVKFAEDRRSFTAHYDDRILLGVFTRAAD